MKFIKRLLLIILVVISFVLISALFIKKEYAVKREIMINQPQKNVYDYLKLLKNQNNFSTFAKKDPNMKLSYRGTDGTIGFIYAWEGNSEVGKGEQKITRLSDRQIDVELHFIDPFESYAPAFFLVERISDNQTKVTWAMNGKMAYPINFLRLFMNMENMIGKEYQQSLINLKQILEGQPGLSQPE